MKPTAFNEKTDLSPLPFSKSVCLAAKKLKESGLSWTPHPGCFVWDEEKTIQVPSPFPNHIYFILNLGHFLKLFTDLEQLKKKLIWLPTEHQASLIAEKSGISPKAIEKSLRVADPVERLISLYNLLILNLTQKSA
jgi:hypothetical protein